MKRMLTIDPGLRECGVAEWDGKKLVGLGLVQEEEHLQGAEQWCQMACLVADAYPTDEYAKVCIELMVARKRLEAAWPNLIQLSNVSGGIFALYSDAELEAVDPHKWTGGRPKKANHPRIRSRLDEAETKVLEAALKRCPADNHKELLDAVGIGLFKLRRL